MTVIQLLKIAKERYPQRTETVKGRVLGQIRWNKDLSRIVSDTVNLYNRDTDSWVEII